MARETVVSLRRAIAVLEGRAVERLTVSDLSGPRAPCDAVASPQPIGSPPAPIRTDIVPFEVPALDRLFAAGGLTRAGFHEVRAHESRDGAAALGFALAVGARILAGRAGAFVFVTEPRAVLEGARLHGPGLHQFGLDPARVVCVAAPRVKDALTVMEDALACRGVAVVLGAVHGQPDALDMTASRRLSLRAREGGGTALLWRPGAPAEPTAALTRFCVAPAPSAALGGYTAGVGRAAFDVDVEKNRDGRTGHASLAWDHHDRRFTPHAAPSVARPAAPVDRPAAAQGVGGAVLAWPGHGRA